MLLMHDVAAYYASVVIDDDGAVATFADRAYHSLRHAVRIVGIAELEEQLLLLVVADDTLVRNGAPEVLVLVDIDHTRNRLDTHACKGLLHVALESLCLVVIDTVARGCLYQQVTVEHFLDRDDITVVQR